MADQYKYWKAALAGERPKMFVDSPEPGFYRSGIYEKLADKARKRVGWSPVAIFTQDGLLGIIGRKPDYGTVRGDDLNALWSYCAGNPISEETYRAVAERGEPWPDSHETVAALPLANSSAEFKTIVINEVMPAPASTRLSGEINLRLDQLAKISIIDSDEASSKARSLQQCFLDLRGEATKFYEEQNRPLLDAQKHLRGIWFPLRDKADEAANKLRTAMGAWEDIKRKAAKVAAERAEAGQVDAKSNVPPPATQIRGGAGKAASVTVALFVTAIDEDAVFKQFKGNPAITELLTSLAQKAIRAGIQVPGATTEERSFVR